MYPNINKCNFEKNFTGDMVRTSGAMMAAKSVSWIRPGNSAAMMVARELVGAHPVSSSAEMRPSGPMFG